MQIQITLGEKERGTEAVVTVRRTLWGILRNRVRETKTRYVCFAANPISGGRWADPVTGAEVSHELASALNEAAQTEARKAALRRN